MSDEIDPEVVADLRLRDATARDSSRAGGNYAWKRPETVAVWNCRVCRLLVEVTQEALDTLAMFNAQLKRRGEDEIAMHEVMVCDRCRAKYKALAGDKKRENVDAMAAAIRQLKASDNPRRERAVLAQLDKLHHPDVNGLLQALDDQRAKGRGKAKGT